MVRKQGKYCDLSNLGFRCSRVCNILSSTVCNFRIP